MATINYQQHKTLHRFLISTGMMAQKGALVFAFTDGRSESRKDLTFQEAGALITHLKGLDASHKMRRKIIKLAHEMGWKLEGTNKIDMDRVNGWCQTYGFGKKPLNDYSQQELTKLVSQFQNGPYKHYLSNL